MIKKILLSVVLVSPLLAAEDNEQNKLESKTTVKSVQTSQETKAAAEAEADFKMKFNSAIDKMKRGQSYLEGNNGGLSNPGLSQESVTTAVNLIVEGMEAVLALPMSPPFRTYERTLMIIEPYFYALEKLTNSHKITNMYKEKFLSKDNK